MNPWPSPRAGVASARRLRPRGPATSAGIRLDALRARGAEPLSRTSVQSTDFLDDFRKPTRARDGSPPGPRPLFSGLGSSTARPDQREGGAHTKVTNRQSFPHFAQLLAQYWLELNQCICKENYYDDTTRNFTAPT